MSTTAFSSLNLKSELISNIETLGYDAMTPIQQQSLPAILKGQDVIAQAQTGSGKTAAFSLGILQKLNVKQFRIQSLVLCPTRELADQVAIELRKLGRSIHNIKILSLCGGVPIGPQIGSLEHGAHIIVGTPGRLQDHLRKGTLNLEHVELLVLDEADRMLDMGFQDAMDAIIEHIPKNRQTLMFSATFTDEIQTIAERIQHEPIRVKVDSIHQQTTIHQYFYPVENHQHRKKALQLVLQHFEPQSSIIFCNTKIETQEIADHLQSLGFSTIALHGDLEQRERNQALIQFSNKSISMLVATDVAARGLDIDAVDAVINYEISRDPDAHIHRIGRTGRAGNKGIACSFLMEKEIYKFERLQQSLQQTFSMTPLPNEEVLHKKIFYPPMVSIQISGGKKHKLRAGDILGALTSDKKIDGISVGKINIFDNHSFVAVSHKIVKMALGKLQSGKMKGRSFQARLCR